MPRCAAPAPSPSWHWDQADRPACPLAPLRAPLWSCDARPSASASTRPVTRKLLALPSKVSPFSSSKVSNPIVYPKDAEALAWLLFRSHFLELQRGTTPTKEARKLLIPQDRDAGCFNPSLWLSESHDLLVAQRLDWIDARRAPRRDVAGRQRHTEKEDRDACKRGKIRRGHAKQQTSHQPGETKGQNKS